MLRAVTLRALGPADEGQLAALFAANDLPDVTRWFDPFPLTPETAHALAHHKGRDLYWGVWNGDELVGFAMVRGWDNGHPEPAYGCFIDHRRHGMGLGTTVTRLVLAELFQRGVSEVRGRLYADNVASLQMLLTSGYEIIERGGGRILVRARPRAGM